MAEGDDTRTKLLTTAIRLFGRHGYDGVSTRVLADGAQVNVAAIKYHFGGKDDLYLAAIDHIVGLISPRLELVLSMAGQARSIAGDDPKRQAVLIKQLAEAVLGLFLGAEFRHVVRFVLRELLVPGPHFPRVYDAVPRRMHEAWSDLVGWVLQLDANDPAVIVRTHAVVGQLIVYQIGRPILQRRLGVGDYTEVELALISQQATQSILLSLGLPHD